MTVSEDIVREQNPIVSVVRNLYCLIGKVRLVPTIDDINVIDRQRQGFAIIYAIILLFDSDRVKGKLQVGLAAFNGCDSGAINIQVLIRKCIDIQPDRAACIVIQFDVADVKAIVMIQGVERNGLGILITVNAAICAPDQVRIGQNNDVSINRDLAIRHQLAVRIFRANTVHVGAFVIFAHCASRCDIHVTGSDLNRFRQGHQSRRGHIVGCVRIAATQGNTS